MPNADATITRTKLIARCFRRVGKSNPTNTEKANAVELLNDLIKMIDAEGRWLWAIDNTLSTLTTVNGQREYTTGVGASNIATNILELETVDYDAGSNNFTPLDIIDKTTALTTTLREGTGIPVAAFLEVNPVLSSNILHLFETPNGAYTIKYTYRRRLYDFDNPSDNPDFPQDWAMRLTSILTYELSKEYGLSLQDKEVLRLESENALNNGLAANAEDPTATIQKTTYY